MNYPYNSALFDADARTAMLRRFNDRQRGLIDCFEVAYDPEQGCCTLDMQRRFDIVVAPTETEPGDAD